MSIFIRNNYLKAGTYFLKPILWPQRFLVTELSHTLRLLNCQYVFIIFIQR